MFDQNEIIKKFFWIIVALIIFYFSIIGTAKFIETRKPSYYVGEIFGKKISKNRFQETYQHTCVLSVLRLGKAFYELEDFLDLENETWERLTLLEEAKQKRIKVSDDEVAKAIAQYQVFYPNNKFDITLYKRIVRDTFKSEPKDFEESLRESLAIEKLYDHVTSTIQISENQLLEEYKKKNDQFQMSYVLIPSKNYLKNVLTSAEEELAFYNRHKKDFLVAPMINVEYVKLDFPKDGGVQKEVEMKFKARAIHDTFYKNPKLDLKAIAPEYHFEAKETGLFSKDNPSPQIPWSFELLRDTFKMKENQVRDPIELKDGYLVTRIKQKRDRYTPSFPEAEKKVRKALRLIKAKALAKDAAQNYLNQIKNILSTGQTATGLTFHQAAEQLKLKAQQSSLFKLGQNLKAIGTSEGLENTIFTLTVQNKMPPPVEL